MTAVETAGLVKRDGWAEGPWDGEPDRVEWRTDDGYVCLVLRNRMGAWCGYVGVQSEHPWHGKDYSCYEDDCGGHGACAHVVDPSVHGGLTFAGPCMEDDRPVEERVCHVPAPGEPDTLWWLGFDCNHTFDIAPGLDATEIAVGIKPVHSYGDGMLRDTYRDLAYVRNEVEDLADQARLALPAT